MKKKVMYAVCSDLHLSVQPPACRADKDWMAVQAHYLDQLSDAAATVLCAGDIFDRWNATPELINFALKHLPVKMVSIPGQHDLPNHSYEERHRSGYEVLHRAGAIIDITDKEFKQVQGFGWNKEIKFVPFDDGISIALVHRYVYINDETKYPGAPKDAHIKNLAKALKPFTAVAFGDNHKGWIRHKGGYLPKTELINCGTFIRRKSDEIAYKPSIGLIYDDGTIERKYLDTSIDKFHKDAHEREAEAFNMTDFIEELEGLGEHGLNFRAAVEDRIRQEDLTPMVKLALLNALRR